MNESDSGFLIDVIMKTVTNIAFHLFLPDRIASYFYKYLRVDRYFVYFFLILLEAFLVKQNFAFSFDSVIFLPILKSIINFFLLSLSSKIEIDFCLFCTFVPTSKFVLI